MSKYLIVKTGNGVRKIYLEDIYYILRRGRKIVVYGEEGEIVFNETMKAVSAFLDRRFFKVMESCYVNLDRIKNAIDGKVVFDDHSYLALSREPYVKTKQRFFCYLKEESERNRCQE